MLKIKATRRGPHSRGNRNSFKRVNCPSSGVSRIRAVSHTQGDPSTQTGQQYPSQAQSGTQQSSQQQQQQTQAKSEHKQSESKEKAASTYLDGKEIMDSRVKDRNGKDLGSVSNLILDRTGHVTYVIVSIGGFFGYGGKKVSVPAGVVTIIRTEKSREIILNMDKDHLDSAPEYNKLANLDDVLYVDTVHQKPPQN